MAFAQLLHAAGESSDGKLSPGTYAVALAADSQLDLERIARRLEKHNVPVHRVMESHGQYAGQLMALGIAPGPKSVRGRHLSNIPLLKMDCFAEYTAVMTGAHAAVEVHRKQASALEQKLRDTKIPWWKRWIRK